MITTTPSAVSWDVVTTALERGGWACFCRPVVVDAIRARVSKIARRARLRIVWAYADGRFAAMPLVAGRCEGHRSAGAFVRRRQSDLEVIDELQRTVRRQAAALAAEMAR